jgi:hypothetical protein
MLPKGYRPGSILFIPDCVIAETTGTPGFQIPPNGDISAYRVTPGNAEGGGTSLATISFPVDC